LDVEKSSNPAWPFPKNKADLVVTAGFLAGYGSATCIPSAKNQFAVLKPQRWRLN